LTPIQRSKAESLQGETVDFVPICFLDLARAASRSVGRVVLPNGQAQGTGFMVSPRLFLTCCWARLPRAGCESSSTSRTIARANRRP
jgi:hypothetical protein